MATYLDASATAPPAAAVLEAMAAVQAQAWGNPSSLHRQGQAAAEVLERARWQSAAALGCDPAELVFTSGGTEAIHLALLGTAARLPAGRLLISSVEHPATEAAARQLERQGWTVERLPVDCRGLLDPAVLEQALQPPTRLVSLIWGQSEVGALQDLALIGRLCREAGVPLHVDAVQVVGHVPLNFARLPVDLLSLAGHKIQGPRGIGALLVRAGHPLEAVQGGGGQEGGRRAGTEAVVLAAGLACALELGVRRLEAAAGADPLAPWRDDLWRRLQPLAGVCLTGPDPLQQPERRLPHHLSLRVNDGQGRPLPGRSLVRALDRLGYAVSSGSACSSSGTTASPVLLALGLPVAEAGSGLRISLGPWLSETDLEGFPAALEQARQGLEATP